MTMRREWKSVPESLWIKWRDIFDASQSGLNVQGVCPVCGAAELHRWYDTPRRFDLGREVPGFKGRGGQWQWCSGCLSYEHYSGLVPDWWEGHLSVDSKSLTHQPEAIEKARLYET